MPNVECQTLNVEGRARRSACPAAALAKADARRDISKRTDSRASVLECDGPPSLLHDRTRDVIHLKIIQPQHPPLGEAAEGCRTPGRWRDSSATIPSAPIKLNSFIFIIYFIF